MPQNQQQQQQNSEQKKDSKYNESYQNLLARRESSPEKQIRPEIFAHQDNQHNKSKPISPTPMEDGTQNADKALWDTKFQQYLYNQKVRESIKSRQREVMSQSGKKKKPITPTKTFNEQQEKQSIQQPQNPQKRPQTSIQPRKSGQRSQEIYTQEFLQPATRNPLQQPSMGMRRNSESTIEVPYIQTDETLTPRGGNNKKSIHFKKNSFMGDVKLVRPPTSPIYTQKITLNQPKHLQTRSQIPDEKDNQRFIEPKISPRLQTQGQMAQKVASNLQRYLEKTSKNKNYRRYAQKNMDQRKLNNALVSAVNQISPALVKDNLLKVKTLVQNKDSHENSQQNVSQNNISNTTPQILNNSATQVPSSTPTKLTELNEKFSTTTTQNFRILNKSQTPTSKDQILIPKNMKKAPQEVKILEIKKHVLVFKNEGFKRSKPLKQYSNLSSSSSNNIAISPISLPKNAIKERSTSIPSTNLRITVKSSLLISTNQTSSQPLDLISTTPYERNSPTPERIKNHGSNNIENSTTGTAPASSPQTQISTTPISNNDVSNQKNDNNQSELEKNRGKSEILVYSDKDVLSQSQQSQFQLQQSQSQQQKYNNPSMDFLNIKDEKDYLLPDDGSILSGDASMQSGDIDGSGMIEDEELDDISQSNRQICKRVLLLESVYEDRPPTIFCPYPSICDKTRNPIRTKAATNEEEKQFDLKYKSARLNCVINSLEASGFKKTNGTHWNFLWGKPKQDRVKEMNKYQKVNHFPGCWQLGRKDNLWRNISRLKRQYNNDFEFIPNTYLLSCEYERFAQAKENSENKQLWIMKPVASACGRGIKVVGKKNKIKKNKHYLASEYISNPHLIDGRKYDLRLYVVVTSYDPLRIYLHSEGLVRFATEQYNTSKNNITEKFIHLTNWSVNKHSQNYQKTSDLDATIGSKWGFQALKNKYKEMGIDSDELFNRIKDVITKTIISAEPYMLSSMNRTSGHRNNCFELYGFDILVDSNLKPWLMEVNVCPSLNSSSQLDKKIKNTVVSDIINMIGLHPFEKKKFEQEIKKGNLGEHRKYTTKNVNDILDLNEDNCLDKLAFDDWNVLFETDEEYYRRGNFERVFPNSENIDQYSKFFEFQRYNNIIVWQWLKSKTNFLEKITNKKSTLSC